MCRCIKHFPKECAQCGKIFSVCRFRKNVARFCGGICSGKYLARKGSLPQCLDKKISKKCFVCKKMFRVKKYRGKNAKFCSYACSGLGQSPTRSGDKSNFWKGGITPATILERTRFKDTVQKRVLKRDDYTCQLCGERGGHLNVDHIQKWSEYVEGRFSIDNCRTLCVECHYKVTFGRDMPTGSGWGKGIKNVIISYA